MSLSKKIGTTLTIIFLIIVVLKMIHWGISSDYRRSGEAFSLMLLIIEAMILHAASIPFALGWGTYFWKKKKKKLTLLCLTFTIVPVLPMLMDLEFQLVGPALAVGLLTAITTYRLTETS